MHSDDSLSFDCFVILSLTYRILLRSIVYRKYLAHFEDSFLFHCFIIIAHTLRIFSITIVWLESCAFWGELSSIISLVFRAPDTPRIILLCLLCSYLAHSEDFLQCDCFVSILRTLSILIHSIVSLVSRALSGFSSIRLFFASISRTLRISFRSMCR